MPHSDSSGSVCTVDRSARLDLSSLDPVVRQLFSACLSPSTRRSYESGTNRYLPFCTLFGVSSPFPTCERILSYFVSFLF